MFLLHSRYPRLFFIQICKSNCVTNYSVTCKTSILSVRKFQERKRLSTDIVPLSSTKGLIGVELVSLAVMSLSLRCCSSSATSTLDLMSIVSTKPASAVSVSPPDDVLLKHYIGNKVDHILTPLPYFIKQTAYGIIMCMCPSQYLSLLINF